MKTYTSRRQNGFTLIELLVVMAIITVLAGITAPMAMNMIQKAKKTTALVTCVALESAVNNFFTEYGAMPTTATTDTPAAIPLKTNSTAGVELCNVLLGFPETGITLNTKAIKFLSGKEGKADKNGLIYDNSDPDPTKVKVVGLFDPWGGPYNVVMDGDYDEKIKVQPKGSSEVTLNGRRVAVWSDGADGVGANVGKAADDVKTW